MQNRTFSIYFCFIGLFLLSACQQGVESAGCFSHIPDGIAVTCGTLDVPEDYAQSNGKTIRLHYAIVHRIKTTPAPDPIVFLAGGPGERVLDSMPLEIFGPYLDTRDVILFDQRGVGQSEPRLSCPDYKTALLAFAQDNDEASEIKAIRDCLSGFQSQGINLAAYTTANNARDVDQLRQALGYKQWNVLATSYGTQLALTIARDTPEGVRSLVLDSVYPLEKTLYDERAVDAASALNTVFTACSRQAACNEAFPNLSTTFNQIVDTLNTNPVPFILTTDTGQVVNAQLNGDLFAALIDNMLYSSITIPRIPQVIADTASGNFASINEGLAHLSLILDTTEHGMQFAFLCNDEVPFDSPGAVQSTEYPGLDAFIQSRKEVMMRACDGFSVDDSDTLQNQPVITDIPTLILAGQFDPITPWPAAQALSQSLPNSVFIQYPTLAHGIALDACPAQMAIAFLNDPTSSPNDVCISPLDSLQFAIRQNTYTLVPFTSEGHSIRGVYPEGWIHREEADFYQDDSRFTSLIYINYRDKSLDEVMKQILPSYQLKDVPPLMQTYSTSDLTYNLYQFVWQQRLTITLAVAELEGDTYMVALASPMADHPTLYDLVLLPALNALQVIDQ